MITHPYRRIQKAYVFATSRRWNLAFPLSPPHPTPAPVTGSYTCWSPSKEQSIERVGEWCTFVVDSWQNSPHPGDGGPRHQEEVLLISCPLGMIGWECHFNFTVFLPQTQDSSINMRETMDKPKLKDILEKHSSVPLEIFRSSMTGQFWQRELRRSNDSM